MTGEEDRRGLLDAEGAGDRAGGPGSRQGGGLRCLPQT